MSSFSTTPLGAQMTGQMRGPSMVIWLCGASVLVFLLWAAFAWVDEIVRAEGSMISSSRPQIIQNLEGGILAELAVGEGDHVEKGDVLARLHGTQFQSAVDDLRDQISAFEIRRLRLEAELAGQYDFDVPDAYATRTPDIVASERALLKARQSDFVSRSEGAGRVLTEALKERELLENMLKKKIVSLIEVTRARKNHADARIKLDEIVTGTELDVDAAWESLCLAMLGEQLEEPEEVCGGVCNAGRLAVWTSGTSGEAEGGEGSGHRCASQTRHYNPLRCACASMPRCAQRSWRGLLALPPSPLYKYYAMCSE